MSSLQSFNSATFFDKKSKDGNIDYDFYDSNIDSAVGNDSDYGETNEGVNKILIKPSQKCSSDEHFSDDSGKEINDKNVVGLLDKEYDCELRKCIAYENNKFDSPEVGCISKSSSSEEDTESPAESPLTESSLSSSTPSSDLTNVTPFSSASSCSSVKYKNDNNSSDDEDESSKLNMKLLTDAVETLTLNKKNSRSPTHSVKSRISNRPRRKNMTFTNEELRKIDRENEILLKKIMSYTKPRSKPNTLMSNAPPVRIKASAAVNRSKQQRQINHDNYILLKKIHNVKSTQSFINRS